MALRRSAARGHGPASAAGNLQINPIFKVKLRPDGGADLGAWFNNTHFALQNARATVYMPRQLSLTPATVAALRAGQRTPEIEALIQDFVLIGLPDHFAVDPLGVHLDPVRVVPPAA